MNNNSLGRRLGSRTVLGLCMVLFAVLVAPAAASDEANSEDADRLADLGWQSPFTPSPSARLSLLNEAAAIMDGVQASPDFGGLYVDQEALEIHIRWVGTPPELPETAVARVRMHATDTSVEQHERSLSALAESLRPLAVGEDDVYVDISGLRYVISTPTPAVVRSFLDSTAGVAAMDSFAQGQVEGWDIEVHDAVRAQNDAYLYSGLNLNICTSGFTLRKLGTQTLYSSTAGHCSGTVKRNGKKLVPVSGGSYNSGVYDVRWFYPSTFTLRNWQQDTTGSGSTPYFRHITSTRSTAYMQGDTVCKMGKTTGWTCGEITGFTSSGKARVARSGVNLTEGGDSGAGWFSGNSAYGIHSSSSGNVAFFMPVGRLNDLGVTVYTG